jgi:O-antigen ligase
MIRDLKEARFPVESGLLIAFSFFLPLLEFWKNLALVAYFVAWLVNRFRAREFGGAWGAADSLVLVWIGCAYVAAAYAGLQGVAWAKTGDLALTGLLFWMVLRAGYGERELRWILAALIVSTVVGLIVGYALWWGSGGKRSYLQLHSVGHVNHSAIYLAIVTGLSASWAFARWRAWSGRQRVVGAAAFLLMIASLVAMTSRAAVGVGFVLLILLGVAWLPRWRAPFITLILLSALTAVSAVVLDTRLVEKQLRNEAQENVLAHRDGIWRMGLAAWERFPWFGVGKDNYGRITHELVRDWRLQAGKSYVESDYVRFPHAHSLYINTLVERGGVGFLSLVAVLASSLVALLRHRPRPADRDFAWLLWGGAVSAWVITCGIGLVNTTFHHEHGMLAALLMALWLSTIRPRRAS